MEEYNFDLLSDRIKYILKAFAMSNRALGQIASISGQSVADIIEGKQKSLKFKNLKLISEKLDISIDWILDGTGHPPKPSFKPDGFPYMVGLTSEEKQKAKEKELIESKKAVELNREELASKLIEVNQKYQALLEKGNADKDRIIELLDKVRDLENKLKNTGT